MSELDVAFRATIEKRGVLRCVDVPYRVTQSLRGRRPVPVIVELAGTEARTSMAPRNGGGFRIFLHSKLRRAAGVDTGEVVQLRVRSDPDSWNTSVPADLEEALHTTPGARAVFAGLTPGLRRELIRFVDGVKSPAAREKRIRDGLRKLTTRAMERARRHKQAASKGSRPRALGEVTPDVEPAGLAELLELYDEAVAQLVRRARALVREVLPDLREEVDRSAKLIGYSVGASHAGTVCTLHLSRKGLKIGIHEGALLPDPRGLMEGAGKKHRHVVIGALKDLRQPGLRPLLRAGRKAARARVGG